jgi:hypothetical protein
VFGVGVVEVEVGDIAMRWLSKVAIHSSGISSLEDLIEISSRWLRMRSLANFLEFAPANSIPLLGKYFYKLSFDIWLTASQVGPPTLKSTT